MKIKQVVDEIFGRSSYGYNPDRDAERDWDAARHADQDFRNRERNAGLDDEEEHWKQDLARQRDHDRGPWYLKVNGKILKSGGEPKVFDWKKGANNYGLAILKNKPELQGKIHLTKKNQDDATESVNEEEMGKISQTTAKDVTIDNPDGTKTIAPLARLTKDAQGNLSLGKPVPGTPAAPGQPSAPPADQQDKIQMGQQVRLATDESIDYISHLAGLSK